MSVSGPLRDILTGTRIAVPCANARLHENSSDLAIGSGAAAAATSRTCNPTARAAFGSTIPARGSSASSPTS